MRRIFYSVTIDTEPDSTVKWGERNHPAFESVRNGIPNLLRPVFKRNRTRPVYFISPAVAAEPACREVLLSEIDIASEIGNHLHADEIPGSPSKGKKTMACFDLSDEEEYNAIKKNHELIKSSLGVECRSYRAGRYAADFNTVKTLEKLGYTVDSSATPGINWKDRGGPDFRGFPRTAYFIDIESGDFKKESPVKHGFLEVPVTISGKKFPLLPDRWYFYRWLRPSIMTFPEMKSLIDNFIRSEGNENYVHLCMMFHSMEVIPGATPFVRTAQGQKSFLSRLDRVLEYLGSVGAESVTLSLFYDIIKQGAHGKL